MVETIDFHRLEELGLHDPYPHYVTVSFDTRQAGIYQIMCRRFESGEMKIEQFQSEPNLHIFTKKEQLYIESICYIVLRIVYDTNKQHMTDEREK